MSTTDTPKERRAGDSPSADQSNWGLSEVSMLPTRPSPLYQKVKEFVVRRIRSGDWPPDSRIPSEHEIVATLGVSRMTVHRALRELTAAGLLVRIQGVGTFVAPQKPQVAPFEVRSIAEVIAEHGGTYSAEVHLLRREMADGVLAPAMGLRGGAPVFHSLIVHHENAQPIQIEDRYVNPAVAPNYLAQDFTQMTPSEYLLREVPLIEVEHVIEASNPDRTQCQLLNIEPSEACLVVTRRTWSHDHVVTQSRFIHPGSRFRLSGRFRPTSVVLQAVA
jgi:GntR family transcriptional regulator, histidine utilization repressor